MRKYEVLPSDFSEEAIEGLSVETLRVGDWQTRNMVTNNANGHEFLVTEYHDIENTQSFCFEVIQIGVASAVHNSTTIEAAKLSDFENILQRVTLTAIRESENV